MKISERVFGHMNQKSTHEYVFEIDSKKVKYFVFDFFVAIFPFQSNFYSHHRQTHKDVP